MQRKQVFFRILRAVFYGALLLFFALMPYDGVANGLFRCPSAMVGLQCPGCGATRAFSLLMHGQFFQAWEMNAVFCGIIFPAFLLVAVQDLYVTVTGKKESFLEYAAGIFSGHVGGR